MANIKVKVLRGCGSSLGPLEAGKEYSMEPGEAKLLGSMGKVEILNKEQRETATAGADREKTAGEKPQSKAKGSTGKDGAAKEGKGGEG